MCPPIELSPRCAWLLPRCVIGGLVALAGLRRLASLLQPPARPLTAPWSLAASKGPNGPTARFPPPKPVFTRSTITPHRSPGRRAALPDAERSCEVLLAGPIWVITR
jgi:hypothetical protein